MFLGIEHHFDKGPYLDGKEQSDEKINPMVCFIKTESSIEVIGYC